MVYCLDYGVDNGRILVQFPVTVLSHFRGLHIGTVTYSASYYVVTRVTFLGGKAAAAKSSLLTSNQC